MPRSFVIGDIHGNHKPLLDLFRQAGFDYDTDILLCLGDVVDRGPEPVKVVNELMKIRNLIYILGNHDYWCLEYLRTGKVTADWLFQGGNGTMNDYIEHQAEREPHKEFFASARLFYIDDENRLFVHAGFDRFRPFSKQMTEHLTLLWDRSLFRAASEYDYEGKQFEEFSEIFIGHSPSQLIMQDKPTRLANLWIMDTGAGHRRLLSLMDIDTKEFWQSRCEF
ncbi:MAG: metallophosphoesterase [Bacteroidota bacterium]|jgi:serine/threonine protein phosphatase 1